MANEPTPSEFGVTRQLQIDAVCVRFEQQWREGRRPQIETILNDYQEPLRSQLLRHLLQLELEYRSGHGEQLNLQQYLDRFPHDQSLIHIVHDEQSRHPRLDETELVKKTPPADKPADSGTSQSDSSLHGRFLPGTRLAGRYRIVSLLGKGGMGEVYRADDLRLGQTVALKFLPRELARDQGRLERFQAEVRLTRQVSHPNVCRVYDMDEVDGQQFLSMEYIDGEDLGVLLRRIGRLPKDKGIQIAQQLCAGLAAAHEKGVLHRDLKPANIMIDGRGQVRITDFGLAKLTEDEQQRGIAGTPAYMAPEQLRRGETTIQSDLYSVGLILHELFTGEAVHKSGSIPELLRQHEDSTPPQPSSHVDDMDPVVVLRCLQEQPPERPQSARAVANSLPGGDPLAAALAAGETPSPDMVAAAGGLGSLDLPVGTAMLAAVLVGLLAVWLLSDKVNANRYAALEKHPQVLADDARDIVKRFGYDPQATDVAWGFSLNHDYLAYLESRQSPILPDNATAQPETILFWYRQSPAPLLSEKFYSYDGRMNLGYVDPDDPAPIKPGMINLWLDTQGRLVEFHAVPPRRETPPDQMPSSPNWLVLLGPDVEEKLGFPLQSFNEVDSKWIPPVAYDTRTAWEGSFPNGTPIRVEAAGYRGRPVRFQVVGEWTGAALDDGAGTSRANVVGFFYALAILISVPMAIYNIRCGRGDRRGAFRLACFSFSSSLLIYLLAANHLWSTSEFQLFNRVVAWTLKASVVIWLSYIAAEPFMRRVWPKALISWGRLLAGRLTDPLVGRDMLIGVLAGTLRSDRRCGAHSHANCCSRRCHTISVIRRNLRTGRNTDRHRPPRRRVGSAFRQAR